MAVPSPVTSVNGNQGQWQGVTPITKLRGPKAQGAPKRSQRGPKMFWGVIEKLERANKSSYGPLQGLKRYKRKVEFDSNQIIETMQKYQESYNARQRNEISSKSAPILNKVEIWRKDMLGAHNQLFLQGAQLVFVMGPQPGIVVAMGPPTYCHQPWWQSTRPIA